jgi:hypothetical protein
MSHPNEPLSPEPEPHCDHTARRVIRLRWPYPEAMVVRARLVTDTGGQFDVSPLYRADAGWAFSICRECAMRGAVALAALLVVLVLP